MERETRKRTNKKWFVLVLLLFVALTTATAFAYWASTINAPEKATGGQEIVIGEGQEITTVIELTKEVSGGVLVPAGRAVNGQVEEVVLTFDVLWTDTDEASHGADGVLTITPEFNENPANLLNVVVNGDGAITAGTTQTVTLTITLTEPADLAEYNLVINQTFTLTIDFSVTPTP